MRIPRLLNIFFQVVSLLLLVKCCILAAFLLHAVPGVNDVSVEASQKKDGASFKTPLKFKEDGCHPEFLSLIHLELAKLEERQKLLDNREQDLKLLERDINDKLKALKELQRRLEGPLKKRQAQEQARLQHLAGVYSSMEPKRAAALLDKMDEDTVVKLFSIMKSKKVAKILANMPSEKAARISSYLYKEKEEL